MYLHQNTAINFIDITNKYHWKLLENNRIMKLIKVCYLIKKTNKIKSKIKIKYKLQLKAY